MSRPLDGAPPRVGAAPATGRVRLLLGVFCGLLVLLLWWWVRSGATADVDASIAAAMRPIQPGWQTTVAQGLADAGYWVVQSGALFVVALARALARRSVAPIALAVVVLGATATLVVVLKDVVARHAPYSASLGSFPSGHAALAAAVGLTAADLLVRDRGRLLRVAGTAVGLLWAVLVGVSRVYLDVHWSTDVLAGWALGTGVFAVATSTGRARNRSCPNAVVNREQGVLRVDGLRVVERDSLGSFAAAWDALVLGSPLPSPFLRTWWLDGIASGRERYVLVLDGDTLVGGLALERHRRLGVDQYRFLGGGTPCPDHMDLVTAPGRGSETSAGLRAWFATGNAKVLDLRGVREDAVLLGMFPRQGRPDDVAPYEELPTTMEGYLRSRSKNFRRNLLRLERQMVRRGVGFRRLEVSEFPDALENFVAIQEARGDRGPLLREMPRVRRAVLVGAQRGEVRMYVAETGTCRPAIVVAFATAGRLSLYQLARRLDGQFSRIGTVVALAALRDAVESRYTEVDFLRGDERYKSSFTSGRRTLWRIRVANRPLGRALVMVLTIASGLRSGRILGAVARFRGILGSNRAATPLVGHVQPWKVLGRVRGN